ncbi:hypothetical protein H7J87_08440 [Mycolicibacterium wolinskyi]|uniref:hypothetical protein n=1 Tax=Mycolicibacterium TaxID=1866885 RepID=UPI0010560264|nr:MULTISPECIES: hypothetical protein [Mycolicibacterium]MCV7285355.1 hypothetical protein [Mycolicibacterium wolinskyi]MCV7295142.1 hypothetical protein [Mycolicibacterium goodii]
MKLKTAPVRRTRRLADGRRLVHIVCPVCDGRHWLPDRRGEVLCPRLPQRAPFQIDGAPR